MSEEIVKEGRERLGWEHVLPALQPEMARVPTTPVTLMPGLHWKTGLLGASLNSLPK